MCAYNLYYFVQICYHAIIQVYLVSFLYFYLPDQLVLLNASCFFLLFCRPQESCLSADFFTLHFSFSQGFVFVVLISGSIFSPSYFCLFISPSYSLRSGRSLPLPHVVRFTSVTSSWGFQNWGIFKISVTRFRS